MDRSTRPLLTVAAAAVALFAAVAAQAGDSSRITREQVRAELAQARAEGTMDRFGEAGATDAVLQARTLQNHTETLALMAHDALDAEQAAHASAGLSDLPDLPQLASYLEAGPEGPLLVLLTYDGDGALRGTDTVSLLAID